MSQLAATTKTGPVRRPNGQTYYPRYIGPPDDNLEDIAFLRLIRDLGQFALLKGPPGTGKTALLEAAFTRDADPDGAHMGFESVICGVDTIADDFFGSWLPNPQKTEKNPSDYIWIPGPLHRAVRYDIPIYIDEIFLADTRVLSSTIYPLMDGRGVLRIPTNPLLPPIPVGKRFTVIASGNPDVPGANFSDALRSRFSYIIETGTDWELALALGVNSVVVAVAQQLDSRRRDRDLTWSPQLRELIDYAKAEQNFGMPHAVAKLIGQAPEDEQPEVADAFKQQVGVLGLEALPRPIHLGTRAAPPAP